MLTQTIFVAFPALVAVVVCVLSGPERAILDVYLPALLLMPDYSWPLSLQLTVVDVTLLAIAPFVLFSPQFRWKWCGFDILVLAYIGLTVISSCINNGYEYKQTQQIAIRELCGFFLPYFIAKQSLSRDEVAVQLMKRIAVLLTAVAILSVYEFRLGRDLFLWPFNGIFPAIPGINYLFRYGFMRIKGPFGHPMALGVIMAIGYIIVRGLGWRGVWKEKLWRLPITKIRFCTWWILGGLIMSISYGDWIGAAAAAVMTSICRAKNRRLAIALLLLTLVFVAAPVHSAWKAYTSVDWLATELSGDKDRSDAAYRSELVRVYIPIIEERPGWGWGFDFPVQENMLSIDNGYLYTALVYGTYALATWAAILLLAPLRLCLLGIRLPRDHPTAATAFTIAAVYLAMALCNTEGALTSNETIMGLFFILTGWSASLLQHREVEGAKLEASEPQGVGQLAFGRVLV